MTARKFKWVVSVKWMMVEVCSGVVKCIGCDMLIDRVQNGPPIYVTPVGWTILQGAQKVHRP